MVVSDDDEDESADDDDVQILSEGVSCAKISRVSQSTALRSLMGLLLCLTK